MQMAITEVGMSSAQDSQAAQQRLSSLADPAIAAEPAEMENITGRSQIR